MSKKRKAVACLVCLLSIYVINMPFMKYYDATPLDLLIPRSENARKALELIGSDLANIVKILFVIMIILEIIAIVLILQKNVERAKRWNFFAGIFESLGALTLMMNVYMYFMQYNELMGLDVLDHSVGKGTYTMMMLGILQMLTSGGNPVEEEKSDGKE